MKLRIALAAAVLGLISMLGAPAAQAGPIDTEGFAAASFRVGDSTVKFFMRDSGDDAFGHIVILNPEGLFVGRITDGDVDGDNAGFEMTGSMLGFGYNPFDDAYGGGSCTEGGGGGYAVGNDDGFIYGDGDDFNGLDFCKVVVRNG